MLQAVISCGFRLCSFQVGAWMVLVWLLGAACSNKPKEDRAEKEHIQPIVPKPSRISMPLQLPLHTLEGLLNRKFPEVLVEDDSFENNEKDKIKLQVKKNGRVRLKFRGEKLLLELPLAVHAVKRLVNLPGKKNSIDQGLDFSLVLRVATPLQLDEQWRIISKLAFIDFEWIEKPELKIAFVNIDLTENIEEKLKKALPEMLRMADKEIYEQVKLDKQLQKTWEDLQKPHLISDKEQPIWLHMRPFEVSSGPINSSENEESILINLQVTTYMHAIPDEDYALEKSTLPRLSITTDTASTFHLHVLGTFPYGMLNQMLQKNIVNRIFTWEDRSIQVISAKLSGTQERLRLKIKTSGDVNGTFSFLGIPYYDSLSQSLSVTSFDFDLETEEWLAASAAWLAQRHFSDWVGSLLTVSLKEPLGLLPELITQGIAQGKAGEKIHLPISAMQVTPEELLISPAGIQLMLNVEGLAELQVHKL